MRIVKPGFEFLGDVDGVALMKNIERAKRVCYKSEDKITEDSYKDAVKDLIARGHEAMLEHGSISVVVTCDRGCCYSDDTMVLTESGFKLFKDVTNSDKFATTDNDGYLTFVKANQIIQKQYCGEMHHWASTQLDLLVTPNHNMWVFDYNKRSAQTRDWTFIKSENANNNRYRFQKSVSVAAKDSQNLINETICVPGCIIQRGFWEQSYPQLELNKVDFFHFLGWWVTDGYLYHTDGSSGNKLMITQVKKQGIEQITQLLEKLGLRYNYYGNDFRISCPQIYAWLSENFFNGDLNHLSKSLTLKIPQWIINEQNTLALEAFLDGVIAGDGSRHTRGPGYQIYTSSYSFALNLVEIALRIGKCANIYHTRTPQKQLVMGRMSDCHDAYVVSIVTTTEPLFDKRTAVKNINYSYKGIVYCVELENFHRLYVMRNGKACWCGNSHEIVRHRLASYAQESTRYVNYSKDKYGAEITVIKPFFFEEGTLAYEEWKDSCEQAEASYMSLLSLGRSPQEARDVLPNSTKTEIVITMNPREWRHFFKLRACGKSGKPHPQMLEIAVPMLNAFKAKLPELFEDLEGMEFEAKH